ncbi:hypothetical protein [Herbaspirillum rhizosphaerae]|uniref:hypothetical protein n=1 Tax=Herbaspirillum rhizosphaerae TaxID=346179 RepID=UPI00067CD819|nr:hypothetical protein [Herbaspirillum rhizosphaerae]
MTKSSTTQANAAGKLPQQAPQANAAEAEVQQARHRTAIRIAGIEGVDGFADMADSNDGKPHPEKR